MQIISSDKTVRNDTIEENDTIEDTIELSIVNYSNGKRRAIGFNDACYQKNFKFIG